VWYLPPSIQALIQAWCHLFVEIDDKEGEDGHKDIPMARR
jgi:hypothetical protein